MFAALLPAALQAQTRDRRDGNWWIGQSSLAKLNYMVGFFDGMELGSKFSYWDLPVQKDKREADTCQDKTVRSYHQNQKKFFSNVTNDQIVDGLDTFYTDYRNRRIMVDAAVWLVVNGIAGTPQKELDKMIESWRRNSDNE